MRELNMLACLKHDISESIANLKEKIAVYSKKLGASNRCENIENRTKTLSSIKVFSIENSVKPKRIHTTWTKRIFMRFGRLCEQIGVKLKINMSNIFMNFFLILTSKLLFEHIPNLLRLFNTFLIGKQSTVMKSSIFLSKNVSITSIY